MAIRILIYGKEGDGGAYAALAQIRTIVRELQADADVQIITDERQLKMNGVDTPPAVAIDGTMVSVGYVPSRNEMLRYIQHRQKTIAGSHTQELM